jgi:hypothetical protein
MDSLLLTSPNLLGKIGLIIYKYHYLRTFPRALLTVGIVVAIAIVLAELANVLARKKVIGKGKGIGFLILMVIGCMAILYKTALDFSRWSYSHTGMRFKYGAYLLPFLLALIFVFVLIDLARSRRSN